MSYLLFFSGLCYVAGLVGVAANPAPYFGVVGLVLSVGGGCVLLVSLGGMFIGLVLFLIYLGGMLVVFAYSVALAAEPYPEAWGGGFVIGSVAGYVGLVIFLLVGSGMVFMGFGLDAAWLCGVWSDVDGVVLLFSDGGALLLLCVVGLVLTLFVVFELVRGQGRGALRVP